MALIFGYGSLANAATHAHAVRPARAHGWRRIWRKVPGYDKAILSVCPSPGDVLSGAVMEVPAMALPALDLRESGYRRETTAVTDLGAGAPAVAEIYVVDPWLEGSDVPILRSYLDVVLSGFETLFGPEAPTHFYATTDGWHHDVSDDRMAPLYPRHQPHDPDTMARFDRLHATVTPRR